MNGASNNKMAQDLMGTSNPIQKKRRTQKKSEHGSTRNPPHTAQAPRETTEKVRVEGIKTETQEKLMEEEIEQDAYMDT
jgi:hypothetical protein